MMSFLKYRKWTNIIRDSGLFDAEYYLFSYDDVRCNDIDPLTHYIKFGAIEGRNPSADFNTRSYLEAYPSVKASQVNPLVHYILNSDKAEGDLVFKKFIHEAKTHGLVSALDKSKSKIKDIIKSKNVSSIPVIDFDTVKEEFISYKENKELVSKVKTIAFYLPQFHPFPENDTWWGKGFTEWTNVTKAQTNYLGHYQPHLPIHSGFYDLRVPEVMIEQAELARNYGIYGFNFYYYWFDGKILMHKPYEILLENKEIDINFCITWANENWTRRWDGAEHDILMAQNHCDEDSIRFIESLYKFFEDERYIRINNKPVLIIYRADIIPKMKETINLWRKKVVEAGFDGIYLICSQTFGVKSPEPYGFDAAMEFPPHTAESSEVTKSIDFTNPLFEGKVYDYNQVVNNAVKKEEPDYKLYRTAMLSWDNTARKQNASHIFEGFTLLRYKQWISNLASRVYNNEKYGDEEKLIFVNAWNEWAEGTHLEPDRKFGYGYLDSTYKALENYNSEYNFNYTKEAKKNNDIALILHVHYTDVWDDILSYMSNLSSFGFDLYVTVTNTDFKIIENIKSSFPSAQIRLVENRGRDILPFIEMYDFIKSFDYKYICKIHSKKSSYRDDGDLIRNELYNSFLGSEDIITKIINYFESDKELGIVCNDKYLVEHTEHNMTYNKKTISKLAGILNLSFKYSSFPAGSMFWFRPSALEGIEKINSQYFDVEQGLADGTTAHGVERLFNLIVEKNGLSVKRI